MGASDAEHMTHYAVLGISRSATLPEIRKAYRALAKEWHPDLHPKSASKALSMMKRINEAWTCLSDEKLRAEYEEILTRFGKAGSNEYAQKRYEEHVGVWGKGGGRGGKRQPSEPREPETYKPGGPRYDAEGRKIPDFVHVDGPRAVFHGKPFRQKNQQSQSVSKRSVVMMGGQDRKVREPRKKVPG